MDPKKSTTISLRCESQDVADKVLAIVEEALKEDETLSVDLNFDVGVNGRRTIKITDV